MKPRRNKLNPGVFEDARQRVKAAFPYEGLKMGFYTEDPQGASVFGGIAKVAKTVLMNIVGDSVDIRSYRKPAKPGTTVVFKIDEYKGVNKNTTPKIPGSQVRDHYIKHEATDDMMEQNNMSIEVVPDGLGGLKPNIQPDGMVKAYINFPDPMEEIRRHAMERATKVQEDQPNQPSPPLP